MRTKRQWGRLARWALAAGAATAMPVSALADGVKILSSHGAEASARGLAFTAKADSFEAFYHNPAGLAQLTGHHVGVSLQYGINEMTFDRSEGLTRPGEEGYVEGYEPGGEKWVDEERSHGAAHSKNTRIAPVLGYVTDFNKSLPFVIGLGVISPDADKVRNYGSSSAARYSIVDSDLVQFNVEAAMAMKTEIQNRNVYVGFTLGNSYVSQMQNLTGSADFQGLETPSSDARIHFEGEDMFTPSFSTGILIDLTDSLTLGGSYRMRTKAKAKGTGYFKAPESLQSVVGAEPITFDIALPVRLPDYWRMGLRYHRPTWDIEFDWIYSRWSYFGNIDISLSNVKGQEDKQGFIDTLAEGLTAEPLTVNKNFKNNHAFGLGGSFNVSDPFEVRGGIHYAQGASGKDTIDPIFVDLDSTAVSTGCGYDFGALELNFAAMYIMTQPLKTSESGFNSINLVGGLSPTKNLETVVGNGEYSTQTWEVLLGFRLDI